MCRFACLCEGRAKKKSLYIFDKKRGVFFNGRGDIKIDDQNFGYLARNYKRVFKVSTSGTKRVLLFSFLQFTGSPVKESSL